MNDMIWISHIHPKSDVFVHVQDICTLKLTWRQRIYVYAPMTDTLSLSCEANIHIEEGTYSEAV